MASGPETRGIKMLKREKKHKTIEALLTLWLLLPAALIRRLARKRDF